MKPLQYSPRALRDLRSIADYIGKRNPERASSFVAELRAKAQSAAERPRSFRMRHDLSPGLRSAVHGHYLLLFRESDDVVRIERIMHSAQDISSESFN